MAEKKVRFLDLEKSKKTLELFRCLEGQEWYVRTLAKSIYGALTHFEGKRSHLCLGAEQCKPALHRQATWKGYTPAIIFLPRDKVWLPVCWELSESAELDVRGRFDRGQEWFLSRGIVTKEERPPIVAQFISTIDPQTLPPAFEIFGVLHNVYRCFVLPKSIANPLPNRVVVEPLAGSLPQGILIAKREAEELAERERQKVQEGREALKNFLNGAKK